ncbi:aldehyde dehydrogenase family protein [Streptomyces sp. NPDC101151]|uniref:aldehyde dehydrogenase family protein n=1 Tax=Streptomyces sp. NPDC101151 TaxID=3366115 RepID=UPI00383048F4
MSSLRSRMTGGQQATADHGRFEHHTGDGPPAAHGAATRAVTAAHEAFGSWAALSPAERGSVFLQAAHLLMVRTGQIVQTMAAEAGSAGPWSAFNAKLAAQILIDAAAATALPTGQVLPAPTHGACSLHVRMPLGVVAAITPRHAPLLLGARAVALPLALGNTVVLKPSEDAPLSGGLLIHEVLTEAGLPDGVLGIVTHAPADAAGVVHSLIADPRVRAVTFTGSTAVGREVAVAAARHLKPAVLELGGKNSLLVLGDADIHYAALAAVVGSFLDAGQGCFSTERVFVDRSLADDFLARVAERVTAAAGEGPTWPAGVSGAMADSRAARRVSRLVADALAKGATAVTGTGAIEADGSSLAPVVLTDVTPDMDVWWEEIAGPVMVVHRVDSVEEAVALAGTPPFGLTAGVITGDWAAGLDIARRLPASAVHVNNRAVADEVRAPLGHVADSGYGRHASHAGVEYFTEARWITAGVAGRPEFPL